MDIQQHIKTAERDALRARELERIQEFERSLRKLYEFPEDEPLPIEMAGGDPVFNINENYRLREGRYYRMVLERKAGSHWIAYEHDVVSVIQIVDAMYQFEPLGYIRAFFCALTGSWG